MSLFVHMRSNEIVSYLRRRHHREGVHDPVGVLLSDLGDQERPHTGPGTTAEGVGQLKSLETIAALGFLADNIEDGVDEFGALCVVTLGPVVPGAALTEDKVVRTEDLAEWSGPDGVHGSGFEVHQDCTWDVFPSCNKNIFIACKLMLIYDEQLM